MNVIVVGCGRLGSELAYNLYKRGHLVAVIDISSQAFHKIPSDFTGRLCEGDAMYVDTLHRAGIETANAVAVVTNSDPLNIIIGRVAREIYHISNVVTRNYEPSLLPLYETSCLQTVGATRWGAQRLEEMMEHPEIRAVLSAGNGEVEVFEINIPAAWDGLSLIEAVQSADCLPIAITRSGKAMLPDGTIKLLTGDLVHVSATFDGAEALRARLSGK